MRKLRYVVDIGSSYTSIYHNGPILNEATAAFIQRGNKIELIAVGNDALKYHDDANTKRSLVSPVKDGVVVYPKVASLMLKSFFKRVIPRTFFTGIEIIIAIPAGLGDLEKEAYETSVIKAGYSDVALVESVRGLNPFVNKDGQLVIIIGDGATEIAVLRNNDIVSACSVNICGQAIDEKIAEYIENVYQAIISTKAAESLRLNIGSLYEGDISSMEICARDMIDNRIKNIYVKAESLKEPICSSYMKIVEVADNLLADIPSKLLDAVVTNGVYLAGSGAQIYGLADFMRKHLQIPAVCDPEPKIAVSRGLFLLQSPYLV
ncbi:MAG: rod shape-determining protein [Christensenellaceae bacterium]|jgi:rod shape-determining protein MreB|nr:rod shape-determining protein [Christensenellaceae bacterium]